MEQAGRPGSCRWALGRRQSSPRRSEGRRANRCPGQRRGGHFERGLQPWRTRPRLRGKGRPLPGRC
eukprot:7680247-Lingulodinium_polyedra.AAC.1